MTAMTNDPQQRPDAPGAELLEGVDHTGPIVVPVSVAPASRLRSPIMEHRPIEFLPANHDRPTVLLPPLRAIIGPSGLALLIAVPMLVVAGLQVALISSLGAAVLPELHRRASRMTFAFGEGFLPYRAQTVWPQGVQEEDDVRWNWSSVTGRGAQR